MKRTFVTALRQVRFELDLSSPLELLDGLVLAEYDRALYLDLGIEFEKSIGKLEATALASSSALILLREQNVEEKGGMDFLNACMEKAQAFVHFLWSVKDNAANIELGFLKEGGESSSDHHSNSRSSFFTLSDGLTADVSFTESETKLAANGFGRMKTFESIEQKGTLLSSHANRFSVFFYHLQAGRSTNDIALKIERFCTGLEALFSSSNSELAHQLAERTAFFLENDPQNRLSVYKMIKSAYAVRSKVSHGATLKHGQIENLPVLARDMDEILRRIFSSLVDEPEMMSRFSKAFDIDDYFVNLIVGLDPNGPREQRK